jgi:hypothetical protein
VIADDLLVLRDGLVLPGPACVDLRPDAASHFSGSRLLGTVAGRERHRLSTDPRPEPLPLAGVFVPEWHDEPHVAIEPTPRSEQLAVLYGQEYVGHMGPIDARVILGLLAYPTWRLHRPRDWSIDAAAALLEFCSSAPDAAAATDQ